MKEKFELVITSKGQTTIPKKVRETFKIKPGSKLLLKIEDKKMILKPKPEDPLKTLLKMRERIKFSEKEIRKMIKESKREWSKL
ncbi:MAG: AbrB/MazE/SpoVT family DNA-binding domain-containing protein [Candidatus Aenigmarchaeota archaeon]|nr:AbrB/MazE/SpoVT family DNA-binding domain-containing protein [Candidatus Aenigmarchaeota archaeon]